MTAYECERKYYFIHEGPAHSQVVIQVVIRVGSLDLSFFFRTGSMSWLFTYGGWK